MSQNKSFGLSCVRGCQVVVELRCEQHKVRPKVDINKDRNYFVSSYVVDAWQSPTIPRKDNISLDKSSLMCFFNIKVMIYKRFLVKISMSKAMA